MGRFHVSPMLAALVVLASAADRAHGTSLELPMPADSPEGEMAPAPPLPRVGALVYRSEQLCRVLDREMWLSAWDTSEPMEPFTVEIQPAIPTEGLDPP